MKDYAFSLAKVLDVRRAEADARARELAEALRAKAAQERKIEGLAAEEQRARQVKRAVLERAQVVAELLHAQRYLEAVGRRVAQEREELARHEAAVASRRSAVTAAMQSVRALERLDERRREEWELESRRMESRGAV